MPIPDDAQCVTLFKNADAEMFGLTVKDSATGLPPSCEETRIASVIVPYLYSELRGGKR